MDSVTVEDVAPMSKTLAPAVRTAVVFDPTSREDQIALRVFMKTGRWIKRFQPEFPFISVPDTCKDKLLQHLLSRYDDEAQALALEIPRGTRVVA